MAGRGAGAEALSTDWSEIVDLFSDATGGVYLDTEFAQCYTGFCTKNGDGLTPLVRACQTCTYCKPCCRQRPPHTPPVPIPSR